MALDTDILQEKTNMCDNFWLLNWGRFKMIEARFYKFQ